jgi:GxxExxY protein
METPLPKFSASNFRGQNDVTKFRHGALSEKIIASAIAVHKELGPGFLESIYEEAIAFELNEQKIPYQRQLPIFIRYKEKVIGMHRLDLLVEDKIVVELKAVKDIDDSHLATCLSYLKATGLEVGLIINFSRTTIRVRRVVRTTALTAEVGDAEGAESFF